MSLLQKSLGQFAKGYAEFHQQKTAKLPIIEHDDDWPSPCELGAIDGDGFISWQAVDIEDELSFDNVEKALELTLHNDIKEYFTAVYSEAIPCRCEQGELELLLAWNAKDFERLQQNLIGHVLMKRRLQQAETLFFAVTDQEEINLVIKNDNGEVWAEPVGLEPSKFVAKNLQEFIASLSYSQQEAEQ
ncbi:SecY-interacting protein [Thalassotalea sp. Y01]|uniref:SecY-interacting protein n=1 Tax=Thalassotalea sp. Y01 TaxID=2729613 RepID=UPI00145E8EA4|nr:SecY-interacting protein [Thalassotalea sp. Y01]NMP16431.1 SecY-interacting protein [Thalassotalea sp. Y01]